MKINDMLKERKGKLIGDIAIAVFFGVMLILAGDRFSEEEKMPRPRMKLSKTMFRIMTIYPSWRKKQKVFYHR